MTVTAIIPAHDAEAYLHRCLEALRSSTHVPDEIVVVNDGSTDDTAAIAEAAGARVIEVPDGPRGPAAARNRGAAVATGDVLLFVDADVIVHRDAVAKILDHLERAPEDAAVFGSYDANATDPGFASQYKNLVHHFVHQGSRRAAGTFWTGCGAIRRTVFSGVGGFDDGYRRAMVEDIELGMRLRAAGHRIALSPDIQVTHMKRWTVPDLVRSDLQDRAIPWTRLILQQRRLPSDLNLALTQRISAVAAWVTLAALASTILVPAAALAALMALAVVMTLNAALGIFLWRSRGGWFAVRGAGMYCLYLLYSSATFAVLGAAVLCSAVIRDCTARMGVVRGTGS